MEGAAQLCPAIHRLNGLRVLDLSGNNILQQGAECLARVLTLENSPKLRVLLLARNRIGDDGLKKLGSGIEACHSLEHLDLSSNFLGPSSAETLAKVVASAGSLKTLDLSGNVLQIEGLGGLLKSLPQAPMPQTLQTLLLRDNLVDHQTLVKLSDCNAEAASLLRCLENLQRVVVL
mmetsp:Transcript_528/g.899  ORF Transcript_528/g.899 Transcript_528/m.899 type:complete len:176 (+) Transcript_528:163-690(+)